MEQYTPDEILHLATMAGRRIVKKVVDRMDREGYSKEETLDAILSVNRWMKPFITEYAEILKNPRGFEVAKGYEGKSVVLPERGTFMSAGYDFRSLDKRVIKPWGTVLINTGVKAYMMSDEVLMIYPRSSLGIKKGVCLANGVAVIDADYYENPENDGQITICLYNMTDEYKTIQAGERIAQGVFSKFTTCGDLPNRARSGGTGSTGKM